MGQAKPDLFIYAGVKSEGGPTQGLLSVGWEQQQSGVRAKPTSPRKQREGG